MVQFLDLSEITVEDTPANADYAPDDAIVCLYDCCQELNTKHIGRILEIKSDKWLVVQFHNRTVSEIIRVDKVARYASSH